MDKLLNLFAAINDDNKNYTPSLTTFRDGNFDFLIKCQRYFNKDSNPAFNFEKVIPALKDFDHYSTSSHISDDVPEAFNSEDNLAKNHKVYIWVKR